MNSAVPCPKCGCPCKVPASAAGKEVKCPRCAAVFSVPAPQTQAAAPAPPAARRSARPLLIGVGVFVALGVAAAAGGLAFWFSRPRPAPPPQATNTPAGPGDKSRDAAKEPAPAGAPARPQFQAERLRSRKNLEEIAQAFFHYAEVYGAYPPSALVNQRTPPAGPGARKPGSPPAWSGLSWRVMLLPFLDEEKLYKEFKLDEPWDSPHNKKLLARMPKIYAPVRGTTPEPSMTYYQVFTGPTTPFPPPVWRPGVPPRRGIGFPAGVPDGTANTLLVAEAGEPVPWTKPADLEYDDKGPLPRLGGLFPDGFHAAACDTTVYFIPRDFGEKNVRALVTCNGGEKLDRDLPADEEEWQTPPDDKTIEEWLWKTNGPSPANRLKAVKKLARLIRQAKDDKKLRPHVAEAVLALCRATWEQDDKLAQAALQGLELSGSPGKEAVLALLTIDNLPKNGMSPFEPIAQVIATRGAAVTPALLEALNHADYDVRARAAITLLLLGQRKYNHVLPKFPVARRPLGLGDGWVMLLSKNDPIRRVLAERETRFRHAVAPAPDGREATERILTLLECLRADPEDVSVNQSLRAEAITALAKIGPPGRVAIPDLFRPAEQTALQISARMRERATAGTDLFLLDQGPPLHPELADALVGDPLARSHWAGNVVQTVARALERKGTPGAHPDLDRLAPLAAARLLAVLRCPEEPPTRYPVVRPPHVPPGWTEEQIEQREEEHRLMDERMRRMDDRNRQGPSFLSQLHAEAARVLGRLGPVAKEAVPDLRRMLKDSEEICRLEAARALLLLNPGDRPLALPVLKACLASKATDVAVEAALALARENVVDRAVFDALLKMYLSGESRPGRNRPGFGQRARPAPKSDARITRLGSLSPDAQRSLVAAGRDALKADDAGKRDAAARLLAPFDPDACLPVLLPILSDPKDERFHDTLTLLARLGPKAKAAFAPLRALLEKKFKNNTERIVDVTDLLAALARTDPDAAVPLLVKVWHDPPEKPRADGVRENRWFSARNDAYRELEKLGHHLKPVIPDLVAALKQEPRSSDWVHPSDPQFAGNLLARAGPAAVPALVELAGQADATHRERAARVLGQMGVDAKPAVPALLKLLRAPEPKVRHQAAAALGRIDPGGEKVVAALVIFASDRDVEMRRQVVRALGGADAIPILTGALADPDADVRLGAAAALGRIGADALPKLREALRHQDAQVRRVAVLSLGRLAPDTPAAVAALIEACGDRDRLTRRLAVSLLDRPGRQTAQAVPAVARALGDEAPSVRWSAAFVLEEFGPRAAQPVPVLTQALKDSEKQVRRRALFALRAVGAAARPAVPEVMKVLLEPDPGGDRWAGEDLSPVAADTLLRVADDPVPLFAEVMQSPRAKGRYAAAGALFQLGSASVPALMKLADAKDVKVRVQAVNCLGCITAQVGKTVPLLVRLLRDDNRKVRREAVYALGSLGPRAKEAVEPLTRIAQDRQDPLQAAASRALERIAPKDPGGR